MQKWNKKEKEENTVSPKRIKVQTSFFLTLMNQQRPVLVYCYL